MAKSGTIKTDSVKLNLLYQSSYQILSIILPFITAPYISRIFGKSGTGIYSFSASVLYFFTMAANLGISNYGNREIAACIDDNKKLSQKFWSIYCFHAIASSLCILVYFVYALFFVNDYKDVFMWQSLQLFAALFDITWFFTGIQRFKVTVIRNFIIRILSVIAIFSFIKKPDDVWKYVLILALGNFLGQIVVWTQLRQYISFSKVDFKSVISHLKPMFILFIPIIGMSIYRYMDKVMIPLLSNVSELGLYENSEKIVSLPLSLITTIGVVLLPKMSSLASKGKSVEASRYFNLSMKYSMIFAFGLTAGIIGIAPVFAPVFFGEEFRECGGLISLLAVTIIFLTTSNSIRSQYLIPNKKDKAFIIAAFSGALANLVINFILIPIIGSYGAVIATIITEIIVMVIHVVYTYKALHYLSLVKCICPFLVPSVIMIVIVRLIGTILSESVFTLVIQIVSGGVSYLVMILIILFLQKDSYFSSTLKSIKAKIK